MKTFENFYPRVLVQDDISEELQNMGASPWGIRIMLPKSAFFRIRVADVDSRGANILKQQFLSVGGEVAVSRNSLSLSVVKTDVIIFATLSQINRASERLSLQPFGLKALSEEIKTAVDNFISGKKKIFDASGKKILIGKKTLVMGILNVTKDSFSDGGDFLKYECAVRRAEQIVSEGADIVDVGGESTRPGSSPVSAKEELRRVLPVVKYISKKTKIPVSIDTYKSVVAKACINEGACIVNDVSGLRFDKKMAGIVSSKRCGLVIMHMKGSPADMQFNPTYKDVLFETINFFYDRISFAEEHGIDPNRIIIDPGIGFGKTVSHNLEIISRLREYRTIGAPVLVGASRKSFIGKILDSPVDDRLEGSIASAVASAINGADIVRAHDVKETARALSVIDAVMKKDGTWKKN